MAVENAFVGVCLLLEVFLPLGLEELQALGSHVCVLSREVVSAGNALLELRITDLSGDRDRNW